jgi:predicted lipid carrier protein YhbT
LGLYVVWVFNEVTVLVYLTVQASHGAGGGVLDHDPDPDVSVGGEYCDLVVLVGGVEDPKLPLDGPTDVVGDALLE